LAIANSSKNYYPLTKSTDDGYLHLSIESQATPIPLNKLHSWIVSVKTPSGKPSQPLEILIDGGMPRHSHGLPTQPQVTRYLQGGKYLIEGLQFHMAGVWQLRFKCLDEMGWHDVTFKLLVGPGKIETEEVLSETEISVIKSLWLKPGASVPHDFSNAVADNPDAAKFGQAIFFDPVFSRNQQISCATCHQPEHYFTDTKAQSQGLSKVSRNAPGLVGVAYNQWFYWDGRRDSLWAQALTPFEAEQEMGLTRVEVLQIIAENPKYYKAYNQLFGTLPEWIILKKIQVNPASPIGDDVVKAAWKTISPRDRRFINTAFANIGKVIAAYERKLLPAPALFDRYVELLVNQGKDKAQKIFTPRQLAGMKLFVSGKSQCLTCHNGSLLSNQSFHNIGTGTSEEDIQDMGRVLGIQAVLLDQFNCQGRYNDVSRTSCEKLKYINRQEIGSLMNGAFKVPSLRNLSHTAPYMHDGRFTTILEVLKHYQNPPDKTRTIHEISKLELSDQDLENIAEFLLTLSGPIATSPEWLKPFSHQ
jgi:cytochrome c peroxidase